MPESTSWSTVVATVAASSLTGIATLLAVLISNRGHAERLRKQHEHDLEAARTARDIALRKEIYIEAGAAIAAALSALHKLSNLESSAESIFSSYDQKAPAIFKAHITASAVTAEKLQRFMDDYTAASLRLQARRMKLSRKIEAATGLLEQAQAGLSELTSKRARLLERSRIGTISPEEVNRESSELDLQFEEYKTLGVKAAALQKENWSDVLRFAAEIEETTIPLYASLVPLLSSVRSELGIAHSTNALSDVLVESSERRAAALAEFIEELRATAAT